MNQIQFTKNESESNTVFEFNSMITVSCCESVNNDLNFSPLLFYDFKSTQTTFMILMLLLQHFWSVNVPVQIHLQVHGNALFCVTRKK